MRALNKVVFPTLGVPVSKTSVMFSLRADFRRNRFSAQKNAFRSSYAESGRSELCNLIKNVAAPAIDAPPETIPQALAYCVRHRGNVCPHDFGNNRKNDGKRDTRRKIILRQKRFRFRRKAVFFRRFSAVNPPCRPRLPQEKCAKKNCADCAKAERKISEKKGCIRCTPD